tara:strand:+ start:512 stop:1270 length:759 start_codon:yes stop_codon:yes gene_type:complete
MKFYFNSSNSEEATKAKEEYIAKYGQFNPNESDVIIPIGGDGFLLKSLHDYKDLKKPFYGINYGSIGFLMNSESKENLEKIILNAQNIELKPLQMKAKNNKGDTFESIAFNEVSLMRQTHQAAKISININGIERMKELICDGVLVSTSAGSTAYNLSAHGSIVPLDSNLLALTPISAFRPRRWRGALLSEKTKINFFVSSSEIRSTSVTADHNEFRNIEEVEVSSSTENKCNILFDKNHSMDERILKEQFFS